MAKTNIETISAPSRVKPLLAVVIILGVFAGYMFFTKPLSIQVTALKTDIDTNTTEVNTLVDKIKSYTDAKKNLDLSSQVKLETFAKAVPEGMRQDEVIRDLISIAEDNQIDLSSIGFGRGGSSSEGVNSLRINSSFEGDFSDLLTFLEGIETNSRLFLVRSISVQITEYSLSAFKKANFSLAIDSFYRDK